MSLHSLLMFCAPMTMACGATLGWPLEKMLSELQSYNATICGSNGCIQWMTKKSSARHQCSQSSCYPFQSLESKVPNQNVRNWRCCRHATILAKLLQAHFPYHFVILPLHLLLTFHCLGTSLIFLFTSVFHPICNTGKNIGKIWPSDAKWAASNIRDFSAR